MTTCDVNNNRNTITTGGVTKSATYDDANQMNTFDGASYTYDRNGNLTGYGSNTLTYNQANKWTSGTIGGTSLNFEYDALGRRSAYKVGATRTDTWYDQTGLVLETGGTNGGRTLRTPDGTPLSRKTGTTLYNYGRDRLGSITALTNTSGALSGSYTYKPYGELLASTGSIANPLRYAGTYFDSTSAWYSMGARYYQTNAGRFTQIDPLPSSIVEPNRFAYVGCNPVNAVDPSGLSPAGRCIRDGVIGFIAGGAGGALTGLALGLASAPITAGASVPTTTAAGAAIGALGGAAINCIEGILDETLPQLP